MIVDSAGHLTAERALEEEIRQEWVFLSPDGGQRWFVGKPLGVEDDDLPSRVMLCPVYSYAVGLDAKGDLMFDLHPVLGFGAKLQRFEFEWRAATFCADMTEGEIVRLARLVIQAEGRKEQLRIRSSGLARASETPHMRTG